MWAEASVGDASEETKPCVRLSRRDACTEVQSERCLVWDFGEGALYARERAYTVEEPVASVNLEVKSVCGDDTGVLGRNVSRRRDMQYVASQNLIAFNAPWMRSTTMSISVTVVNCGGSHRTRALALDIVALCGVVVEAAALRSQRVCICRRGSTSSDHCVVGAYRLLPSPRPRHFGLPLKVVI